MVHNLVSPILVWVSNNVLICSPDGSGKVWSVIGNQASENNRGARLEIFFIDRVALVINRGQGGYNHYQVHHQRSRGVAIDLEASINILC